MKKQEVSDNVAEVPANTWLFDDPEMPFDQMDAVHFREMVEVSDTLMAGYARFIRQGMPREMVGHAMLGATMNLYDVFDMRARLPGILRNLADRLEEKTDSAQ